LSPPTMPYQYKREPLTPDEANRLAATCATHQERLIVWTLLDTCSGLQSKRAGTAISAFSGPHYLHLSLPSGPHYLHLRLQSATRDCNQRCQDDIICN
jgi:hypothetical protein